MKMHGKLYKKNLDSYILPSESNSVGKILELSYNHLPNRLKPCFLYFGVSKEDVIIHVKELIRTWILLGFIYKDENTSEEGVAKEYLTELINRSLVIVTRRGSDGRPKVCIIHDLLRDLCLKMVQKGNFLYLYAVISTYGTSNTFTCKSLNIFLARLQKALLVHMLCFALSGIGNHYYMLLLFHHHTSYLLVDIGVHPFLLST